MTNRPGKVETHSTPAKTLRDELAMAAVNGLLASEEGGEELNIRYSSLGAARRAYAIADAMLAVREEKTDLIQHFRDENNEMTASQIEIYGGRQDY